MQSSIRKPYCCILDLTMEICLDFPANCELPFRNSRSSTQIATARRQRNEMERKKGCVTHSTSCLCCGHGHHPTNHAWGGCGLRTVIRNVSSHRSSHDADAIAKLRSWQPPRPTMMFRLRRCFFATAARGELADGRRGVPLMYSIVFGQLAVCE